MSDARKLILWDLDGTLCPHNEQFHHNAPLAVAQAALKMGVDMSLIAAIDFARQHYPGQRTAVQAFAKTFGLDPEIMFQHYYTFLRDNFLEPNPALIECFQNHLPRCEYGVLTQAPEVWAETALRKLGLLSCFTPEFVFGYQHLQQRKKTDPVALAVVARTCQERSYPRSRVVVVDDSLQVLDSLHEIDATRIWLSPDKPSAGVLSAACIEDVFPLA